MAEEESCFLRACRGRQVPYTPVWVMRQSGRYLEEYRKIRKRVSFLELCKTPELATEVAVMAQAKIKADAAIVFSDLLLILETWGMKLDYPEKGGPVVSPGITSTRDIDHLPEDDPVSSLSFVLDAVRLTRSALPRAIPLIGFAGAPFTLASYLLEGGKSKGFEKTKKWMHENQDAWGKLLEKIVRGVGAFVRAQIKAGVDCIQVFDSWAGCLLQEEYEQFVFPFSKKLFESIPKGIPVIHFGTGTAPFLEIFSGAGGDVVGIDHGLNLHAAWQRIGPKKAIQGNLDPRVLLEDPKTIQKEVERILLEAGGRPGHIFNLGHGVLPETPVEHVIAMMEAVHELSRR